MKIYKQVLTCWICGKEHDLDLYDKWLKDKRVYECECGGQVISNSGKVMLKHIPIECGEFGDGEG